MDLKNTIREILREEVQRKIISEAENNIPDNVTYTLPKEYRLNSDSMLGDDVTLKGNSPFVAHQSNNTSTVRIESRYDGNNGVTFYCSGKNQGKFWHPSYKSWYNDEQKTLSNVLLKRVCFKAYRDQYHIKNKGKYDKQSQQKSLTKQLENSPYVDAKGNKALYYQSTEFKKTNDFLLSQGLNVRGVTGYQIPKPQSPNQHYNYAALFSIKQATDYAINKIGWSRSECLRIGMSELGDVKMKSKLFSKYNSQLSDSIKNVDSPLYTQISTKVQPPYANFILSDFYFKFGNLIRDVEANPNRNDTYYFPDGVYNFMGTFFGTLNVSQIQKGYSKTPGCQGNNVDWHSVLTTLQFASAFIPVVGPFIAAGLGIADAAVAYNEGHKGEAAIGFILSAIPLASEIPGLKSVGQSVLKQIGSKILTKVPLTAYESEVAGIIKANEGPIAEYTQKWVNANIKNKTVQHIARTAEEKGEEWLRDKIKEKVAEKTGLPPIPVDAKDAKKMVKDYTKDKAIHYLDKKLA